MNNQPFYHFFPHKFFLARSCHFGALLNQNVFAVHEKEFSFEFLVVLRLFTQVINCLFLEILIIEIYDFAKFGHFIKVIKLGFKFVQFDVVPSLLESLKMVISNLSFLIMLFVFYKCFINMSYKHRLLFIFSGRPQTLLELFILNIIIN